RDGALAAEHRRRGERRGGSEGHAIFEACQPARQLVHEGHGFCSADADEAGEGTTRQGPANVPAPALVNERRCDSLNPNGMSLAFLSRHVTSRSRGAQKKQPPARTLGSFRWRPGGPSDVASP